MNIADSLLKASDHQLLTELCHRFRSILAKNPWSDEFTTLIDNGVSELNVLKMVVASNLCNDFFDHLDEVMAGDVLCRAQTEGLKWRDNQTKPSNN